MKKYTKIISIILIIILAGYCTSISGVFALTKDLNYNGLEDLEEGGTNHFSAVMHTPNNGNSVDCKVDFNVNYLDYTNVNNKVYNCQIASFLNIYAANANEGSFAHSFGSYLGNTSEDYMKDSVSFAKSIGLDDANEIKVDGFTDDPNDTAKFTVGHYTIKNAKKEIIILGVANTSSLNQSLSNIDIGADSKDYKALGSHKLWKNKSNHKGFDVTANRVYKEYREWEKNSVSSSYDKTILITGFGRGGSVANILGTFFEKNPKYKSFTYTFGAFNTTTDKKAKSYYTIFNVENTDDIITKFPLKSWGFTKFGTNLRNPVNKKEFKELTHQDYTYNKLEQNIIEAVEGISPNRETLYKVLPSEGTFIYGEEKNNSEDIFKSIYLSKLTKYNLDKNITYDISQNHSNGKRQFIISISPIAAIQDLTNLICGYRENYHLNFKFVNADFIKITDSIFIKNKLYTPFTAASHYFASYYLLCNHPEFCKKQHTLTNAFTKETQSFYKGQLVNISTPLIAPITKTEKWKSKGKTYTKKYTETNYFGGWKIKAKDAKFSFNTNLCETKFFMPDCDVTLTPNYLSTPATPTYYKVYAGDDIEVKADSQGKYPYAEDNKDLIKPGDKVKIKYTGLQKMKIFKIYPFYSNNSINKEIGLDFNKKDHSATFIMPAQNIVITTTGTKYYWNLNYNDVKKVAYTDDKGITVREKRDKIAFKAGTPVRALGSDFTKLNNTIYTYSKIKTWKIYDELGNDITEILYNSKAHKRNTVSFMMPSANVYIKPIYDFSVSEEHAAFANLTPGTYNSDLNIKLDISSKSITDTTTYNINNNEEINYHDGDVITLTGKENAVTVYTINVTTNNYNMSIIKDSHHETLDGNSYNSFTYIIDKTYTASNETVVSSSPTPTQQGSTVNSKSKISVKKIILIILIFIVIATLSIGIFYRKKKNDRIKALLEGTDIKEEKLDANDVWKF